MNKSLLIVFILLLSGCSGADDGGLKFSDRGREVPVFNSDTAFAFIERQLGFGPRVPNTEAHTAAKNYYSEVLKSYAGSSNVFVQNFSQEGYDESLHLGNVIAAFNTTSSDRIMLCAHWDTRPRADMADTDTDQPIPGADDGASGVGVLLELARIFSENPPPVGVDLVLFDGEDYGTSGDLANYFLGSRYWADNPPVPGYKPRFGILLDMVGAENAQFPKEAYSTMFAPNLMREVWSLADEKGYDNLFLNKEGAAVSDDHVIVNQRARIPIINIINHTKNEKGVAEFPPHWHTHDDNIDIISTETLQAVGDVLVELIYNRL